MEKQIEEFAKELSAKVRWSSGYGQYENNSKEEQAYIDGVTTAIGMMYIDLTGSPRSEGMLAKYLHQELQKAREEERKSIAERVRIGRFSKVANDDWNDENTYGYREALKDVAEYLENHSELDQPTV